MARTTKVVRVRVVSWKKVWQDSKIKQRCLYSFFWQSKASKLCWKNNTWILLYKQIRTNHHWLFTLLCTSSGQTACARKDRLAPLTPTPRGRLFTTELPSLARLQGNPFPLTIPQLSHARSKMKEFIICIIFLEIPLELQSAVGRLMDHSKAILTSLNELEKKVTEGKKILMDINKLKSRKDFLSREQIEETKNVVKARLMQSRRLHDEINNLKSSPGFLSREDLLLCQEILQEFENEMWWNIFLWF